MANDFFQQPIWSRDFGDLDNWPWRNRDRLSVPEAGDSQFCHSGCGRNVPRNRKPQFLVLERSEVQRLVATAAWIESGKCKAGGRCSVANGARERLWQID